MMNDLPLKMKRFLPLLKMNLCLNARTCGNYIKSELINALEGLPIVKEIRCKGLMIGIELKVKCIDLVEKALDNGLVINVTKEKIIRMLPPLIITREESDEIVKIIKKIVGEVEYE